MIQIIQPFNSTILTYSFDYMNFLIYCFQLSILYSIFNWFMRRFFVFRLLRYKKIVQNGIFLHKIFKPIFYFSYSTLINIFTRTQLVLRSLLHKQRQLVQFMFRHYNYQIYLPFSMKFIKNPVNYTRYFSRIQFSYDLTQYLKNIPFQLYLNFWQNPFIEKKQNTRLFRVDILSSFIRFMPSFFHQIPVIKPVLPTYLQLISLKSAIYRFRKLCYVFFILLSVLLFMFIITDIFIVLPIEVIMASIQLKLSSAQNLFGILFLKKKQFILYQPEVYIPQLLNIILDYYHHTNFLFLNFLDFPLLEFKLNKWHLKIFN